jgi:hypothetical protein
VLLWQTEAGPIPEGVLRFRTPGGLTQNQVFTANAPEIEVPVGAGGSFSTQDLRAGTWQVSFQPDDGGTTEPLSLQLSGDKDQALTLPFPGFAVAGTVLDAEGKPVREARVRETEGGTTTLSAGDGSFRFDGLRRRIYFFRASKDDATSDPVKVAVGEGQEKAPILLTLRDDAPRPALTVHVTDERGVPAPGAFVFVDLPGRGLRVLTADLSGTASLLLDPPYPETVRAAARIGAAWSLGTWEPFDRAQDGLALSPGATGSLAVASREATGSLQIAAPGGWNLTALLGILGIPPLLGQAPRLEITGLPVGAYVLTAGGKTRSADVQEGQRVEVDWASASP